MKERSGKEEEENSQQPPRLKSVEGGSREEKSRGAGIGAERGRRLIGREIWGKRFDN